MSTRTASSILSLALMRGWNSMALFGYLWVVLLLIIAWITIVYDYFPPGIIIGALVLVQIAAIGLPIAFVLGGFSGLLYAVSESFWIRQSCRVRILAWLFVGLLLGNAVYFLGVAVLQPFQWDCWVNPMMLGRVSVYVFLLGLILPGIASCIDGLFLAGLGAAEYKTFVYYCTHPFSFPRSDEPDFR